jgi:hypothetical protein
MRWAPPQPPADGSLPIRRADGFGVRRPQIMKESRMSKSASLAGLLALLTGGPGPVLGQGGKQEELRYTRPAGAKAVLECTFRIARHEAGWTIASRTDRGAVKMEVEARYDGQDRLIAARAVLTSEGGSKPATVEVMEGKALVKRPGAKAVQFDAPRGTIVTSAPDWSDIFLLCRRYDRERKGKQQFPALWIHPIKTPQRLTFSIEWQGVDRIRHAGKEMELTRYRIHIRNNSAYAAWADSRGRLIRLIPLPGKAAASGMTLEGFERSAASLRPPRQG